MRDINEVTDNEDVAIDIGMQEQLEAWLYDQEDWSDYDEPYDEEFTDEEFTDEELTDEEFTDEELTDDDYTIKKSFECVENDSKDTFEKSIYLDIQFDIFKLLDRFEFVQHLPWNKYSI